MKEAKKNTTRRSFTCCRCGWSWFSRIKAPKVCAKCHSAYWNTPKEAR
jgi:hypothetical protein